MLSVKWTKHAMQEKSTILRYWIKRNGNSILWQRTKLSCSLFGTIAETQKIVSLKARLID